MKYSFVFIFLVFVTSLTGQVKISPAVHDFGYVPEKLGVIGTQFTIENIGSDTINIIHLKPSCGCAIVLPDTTVILPKGKVNLNVDYQAEGRPGEFFKTVKVHLKSRSKIWATHIGIKGYVIPKVNQSIDTSSDIQALKIKPFTSYFRHQLDTTGSSNRAFQKFVNGLTYAIDKDQFVLIKPIVNYYHEYAKNHQYILDKLKQRLFYELNRRGYTAELVLFQIPEINLQPNQDFLNVGDIQLQVMGYHDTIEKSYVVDWSETQKKDTSEVVQLERILSLTAARMSGLQVSANEEAIYKFSNKIVRLDLLGQLHQLQVSVEAASKSKKIEKFIENWKSELQREMEETVPDEVSISWVENKFIEQKQTGQDFKIHIDHILVKAPKDTITHVFQLAEEDRAQPEIPVIEFKTKKPGKGDLELNQKKRLFANFEAHEAQGDALDIICVLQHNGYLFEKGDQTIADAITHYKIVLEALQREAERQGFSVTTKFWIQPFHVTHWNKKEQNHVSIQFLTHINPQKEVTYPKEKFLGIYYNAESDSIEWAGVHHYYLDEMTKIINEKGWMAINIESYLYVEDDQEDMKAIQVALIEQTKDMIDQLHDALLKRGVDPKRLILNKEKIIVRNKPLDNVSGFGNHQPKNTLNKRFTKIVFNPEFDFE